MINKELALTEKQRYVWSIMDLTDSPEIRRLICAYDLPIAEIKIIRENLLKMKAKFKQLEAEIDGQLNLFKI
jgi:hypothetical protein